MKVVGLFRELGRGVAESVQSIHEVVGTLSSEDVASVTEYLRSGVPIFDVMEASVDPLDSSIKIDGGPSLVSDGVWVWRNDLAYFVKKYRVGLPEEFVAHALEKVRVIEGRSAIIESWEDALEAYELAEQGDTSGK